MFTRPKGSSSYQPFTPPSGTGGATPQLVTDPNGYLIATWTANGVTYTSVYDGVPPAIDSVTPPSGAVAGQPATITVSGSDVWGPVSFSVDWGDGSAPTTGRVSRLRGYRELLASHTNSVSHTYAGAGSYTASITVSDSAGNSVSTTRSFDVAPAPPPPPPPPSSPPPSTLPDPVAGQTLNVFLVSGVVLIQEPGSKKFVPLTKPSQIRNGSIIDARKGRVEIVIDDGAGHLDVADFYEGMFKFVQSNVASAAATNTPKVKFANLYLVGGKFKGCPKAPRHPRIASAAKNKHRSIQHLWGSGHGAYRTVGRFASATVRGTTWLTDDRCDGTLTRVTAGKIGVRDFVKNKTIVVTKGKSYFAQP